MAPLAPHARTAGRHALLTVRRTLRLVVAFALTALMAAVVGVGQAQAAGVTATVVDLGPGLDLGGRINGFPRAVEAYTIVTDAGEAYCVDIATSVAVGDELRGVPGSTARPDISEQDLARIRAVAARYPPQGGAPLPAEGQERRAAVQAAIWNLSDGFELSIDGTDFATPLAVELAYQEVLAFAAGASLDDPVASVTLEGVPDTVVAGEPTGPVTVRTTAPSAVVTVTGGLPVDADGTPMDGPVADGTRFWVLADDAAPGTGTAASVGTLQLTVAAEVTAPAGMLLAADFVQSLVIADGAPVSLSETYSVSVTAPAPPQEQDPGIGDPDARIQRARALNDPGPCGDPSRGCRHRPAPHTEPR